jgi:hypothetical protein
VTITNGTNAASFRYKPIARGTTGSHSLTVSAGGLTPASQIQTIAKANQTITFGALGSKAYGDPDFTVSATASSGLVVTFAASGNCTVTGNSVHITGAGSCTITASQPGDTNYNAASTVDQTFSIGKAATTTTVTCGIGPFTYTGSAQTPCSAVVTGPGLNQSLTVNYTNNMNAGTASASASYAADVNYLASNDTETFTIDKASSTSAITCPASVTYNGLAQEPCSATVTGVGPLNMSLTVVYANNTDAGTATANATFAGDANHHGSTATQASFTINKATSTTTTVGDGPFTYDGTTHAGGSGTVTGAGSLSTSATSLTYTGDQVNAGTYYVTAHYAGDANHEASDGAAVAIVINKAASMTTIACPSNVTYTGLALTPCTADVTGVGGLNQSLTVSYTSNANPGTATANASYAGDSNHTSSSSSKTFSIGYGACSPAAGPGGVVLQPINTDGSSVFARKGGSTIPVKFRVCDASGNPIASAMAVFAGTGGSLTMLSAVRGTIDSVNETGVTEIPDAAFRYSGGQWIYNMATNNLTQGSTYQFRINLAAGNIIFTVGVK